MTTFLRGDCLEVMKTLPDKSVDCFVCDLPYGCLSNNGKPKISEETSKKYFGNHANILQSYGNGCSWDIKIDIVQFWTQVKRLCKSDNTPVLMFCNTRFGIDLINSNPTWFRYDLVWNKEAGVSFLLANKQPMKSHEMIYVFSKKGCYYKRIDEKTEKGSYLKWGGGAGVSVQYSAVKTVNFDELGKDGLRCPLSVINIKGKHRKGGHPTEKPMAVYTWLLSRYCPDGGTVLDPTAGSFNSIMAAEELGCIGIGIEMDETFFTAAVERHASLHDMD